MQLKDDKEKFRGLFEYAPLAYQSLDKNGCFLEINSEWTKLTGYSKKEIIGKYFREILERSDTENLKRDFEKFKLNGKINRTERRIKTKDGSIKIISLDGRIIYNENGEVEKTYCILKDKTSQKKIERESIEAFRRANLYRDLFAHDFNNILNNVLASIELSKLYFPYENHKESISELFQIIENQAQRGIKLIYNIRKLAELDDKKFKLEKIEVCNLLKASFKLLKSSSKDKNITTTMRSPRKMIFVKANSLLQDVFENLLINAINYNANERILIEVEISELMVDGKSHIKFEFKDNGIGISNDMKNLIFTPGNFKSKGGKGLGFGLSIVKKIIDSYDGNIWIQDRIEGDSDKGSNFIITIPAFS
ncbi:MAG: PAS domain-containing sensor histidine kinase [Candidatus Lokiarchaeota archaeon]